MDTWRRKWWRPWCVVKYSYCTRSPLKYNCRTRLSCWRRTGWRPLSDGQSQGDNTNRELDSFLNGILAQSLRATPRSQELQYNTHWTPIGGGISYSMSWAIYTRYLLISVSFLTYHYLNLVLTTSWCWLTYTSRDPSYHPITGSGSRKFPLICSIKR